MARVAGKYYSDVKAGNVFIGSTAAAGVALPISTGTAVTFGLWNTSSNKDAVLLRLTASYTSGTLGVGTLGLANQYCGFALGTAAPLSAFTDGTPKNALLGGASSVMRFTPSAATLTAGGTACWFAGHGALTAAGSYGLSIDLDGSIIVPPGQLVFACSSVAQAGVQSLSLMWAEVPA